MYAEQFNFYIILYYLSFAKFSKFFIFLIGFQIYFEAIYDFLKIIVHGLFKCALML